MSKALSVDLRECAVAAVREGATYREAAERFGGERGECEPLARDQGDVRPKALDGGLARLASTPTRKPSSMRWARNSIVRSRRLVWH